MNEEERKEEIKNKRNFFRISLYEIAVDVILSKKTTRAIIKDISGNGMSFFTKEKIAFDICEVYFKINQKIYHLDAKLIRKEDVKFGEYTYAVNFIRISEKTKTALTSELLKIDAKRRKK